MRRLPDAGCRMQNASNAPLHEKGPSGNYTIRETRENRHTPSFDRDPPDTLVFFWPTATKQKRDPHAPPKARDPHDPRSHFWKKGPSGHSPHRGRGWEMFFGLSPRTNLWNKGLISADRSSTSTLLLTIPRSLFKSSAKDLSSPISEIMIRELASSTSATHRCPPNMIPGIHRHAYL